MNYHDYHQPGTPLLMDLHIFYLGNAFVAVHYSLAYGSLLRIVFLSIIHVSDEAALK
jgi:hypothetical protein